MSGESGQRSKVFGLGYMKTGTSSLGACLHTLGYRHFSYYPKLIRRVERGDVDALWDIADRYDSFEDHPWPGLYRELDERYPDAKFVLTVRRDSETWFRSLANHAKRRGFTVEKYMIFGHGWPRSDKAHHIDQYERHNRDVQEYFASRPNKLLTVCWETGSNWNDVAEFLGDPPGPENTSRKVNVGADQRISPKAWLRNTTKYLLIGRLGIDPFRNRGFDR